MNIHLVPAVMFPFFLSFYFSIFFEIYYLFFLRVLEDVESTVSPPFGMLPEMIDLG